MDRRLLSIYNLIDTHAKGLCDVGTDHGMIPIRLALDGFTGDLIASDIKAGPLSRAEENALSYSVHDRITFCLCDGIPEHLSGRFDTVVVAGMGGDLICSILDKADWIFSDGYTLILQPMTKQEVLRYYLINNGFFISDDILAEDSGRIYQIIRCRYTGINDSYSDHELYIGKKGRCPDQELYSRAAESFRKNLEKIISGCGSSEDDSKRSFYINMAHQLGSQTI